MAASGEKRVQSDYSPKIGIGQFEILGVNLSNEDVKKNGFFVKDEDLEKERDFTGTKDVEGIKKPVRTVRLEFLAKELKGENPHTQRFSFFLEDRNRVNKNGDLYQFINNQGNTFWSTDPKEFKPSSAAPWFAGVDNIYEPRPAKEGEEHFMSFMRSCMAVDFGKGGTLTYNISRLFDGKYDELNDDLESDFASPVLVAVTVKEKEEESEDGDTTTKFVQSFYNKAFAAGALVKFLNNKKEFTEEDVKDINNKILNNKGKKGKDREYVNDLQKMVVSIADSEHGCKDLYSLTPLKTFKADDYLVGTDEAVSATSSKF